MSFLVKPTINRCGSLNDFFTEWQVGQEDLIVTNEYILAPQLNGIPAPCDTLYQERYGVGEPSDEMVNAMLEDIAGKAYRRIIAIGGGTVMDVSKLFVFGGGLDCEAIFAMGAELPKERSLILIPTTCGTGGEVTGISIVEFKKKGTKLGLSIPALFADEAVLIPPLLQTLPYGVFAASSIDALIHASESYVSPKANAFTRALGRCAIELILAGYQAIAETGAQKLPEKMDDFLSASTMAGIAFGNAGCAAVHALSYPIGGGYHVPHGNANYMVFEEVFAEYRTLDADLSPLEELLTGILGCDRPQVWDNLFALLDRILTRQPLKELGVTEEICSKMAASVIQNQQRLLVNNPVPLTQEQVQAIYMRCM